MTKDQFLELVAVVLDEAGRGRLPENSPMRDVIEVRPDDIVLQVLAGPGSGKTEALTWRVLYEIIVNSTPSNRILVTTFTRRAATELQVRLVERADAILRKAHEVGIHVKDPQVHDIRVGTLHGLCDSLLVEFDPHYKEAGTILIDENEALVRAARSQGYGFAGHRSKIVAELSEIEHLNILFRPPWVAPHIDYLAPMMKRSSYILELIGQLTETWIPRRKQNSLIGIEEVHGPKGLTARLERLLERWNQYLDNSNILDFRTIQRRFWERQEVVASNISHVFVDEFQDNNPIQFEIHLGWLRAGNIRLTVVGDDDQAIYRFRGSDAVCFSSLKPRCEEKESAYRLALLDTNYRSTRNIVEFAAKFREYSSLGAHSMPKEVRPSPKAGDGDSVRLLTGKWADICETVAAELDQIGVGRVPGQGKIQVSACILLFSSSERESRDWTPPAVGLRAAIEAKGMRVYNPRNKQAAEIKSEVGMLLGLLSYLIDPISRAPVGKDGRLVEVWASNRDGTKSAAALSAGFNKPINDAHTRFQKGFRKPTGSRNIEDCPPERKVVLNYIDELRLRLTTAYDKGRRPRMSLAGVVARLLAQPYFRDTGFTEGMFRQALFTQLLEANVAPTRLTSDSLDKPLEVSRDHKGKFVWADRFWWLLNYFGAFLDNSTMDDLEVAAFEENAVPVVTFHQAKGLEFDHVYVAATGRDPDIGPALRTRLFSGDPVQYSFADGLVTNDTHTRSMAEADRDREVYVALTRAKKSLTVLHDTEGERFMQLHEVIDRLIPKLSTTHQLNADIVVREWCHE